MGKKQESAMPRTWESEGYRRNPNNSQGLQEEVSPILLEKHTFDRPRIKRCIQ
jgi:hypothetical protein